MRYSLSKLDHCGGVIIFITSKSNASDHFTLSPSRLETSNLTTFLKSVKRTFQNCLICLFWLNIDGDIDSQRFQELIHHSNTSKILEFAVGTLSQEPEVLQEKFQVLIFKKLARLDDCKRACADSKPLWSNLRRLERPLSSFKNFLVGGPSSLPVPPVAPVLDRIFYYKFVPVLFITSLSNSPCFITYLQAILEIQQCVHSFKNNNTQEGINQFSLEDHFSRSTCWIFKIFGLFEREFKDL